MEQKLAIPKNQIAPMCLEYYTTYGTTMAGLVEKGYQIDFDDWHAHAHGVLSPAMIWLIVAASAGVCLALSRLFRPVEAWAARAGTLACTVMLRDR